ncbi:hypothetical protein SETIT_4G025900v2 [Setaria italica]|uniref:DUF3615 domain-containing protein n=1 Tax=Setaria italica TaxID=4555 RepID=A0A368QQ11_SETIT|nr:hypothetical protein SETIT_4G025900v2 [Setaria italica]
MVPHNTIDGPLPSASSLGSNILIRQPPNSFEVFYIRIDRRGTFWMYPNLGGPFQSIDETEKAINSFLDMQQCEARTGTKKENTYSEKWYLVQAILDHFNDENNLSGNLAYELEDLLRKQWVLENLRWYYHFNFTTKQKADDNPSTGNKLFFAEVSYIKEKDALEVNCCRMIKSIAEGGHCFGCKNNGSPDMQHPIETDAYTGGHLDGYLPFGCDDLSSSDDNDDDGDEEEEEEDDDDD